MARQSHRSTSKPYLVISTASSEQEAKKIAHLLIRNRLAACVNIVSKVNSLFWWAGSIDRAKESLLIIKTKALHLKRLEQMIRAHHSYSVPEIIGWPIRWGSKSYLRWLGQSVLRK